MSALARRARPASRGALPSGRHGIPRAEVRRIQLQRIRRATLDAVAELGYEGATITVIIGRAGVSRKTFYELFVDRADCFAEAFGDWLDDQQRGEPHVALLDAAVAAARRSGARIPALRGAPVQTAELLLEELRAAGWQLVRAEPTS